MLMGSGNESELCGWRAREHIPVQRKQQTQIIAKTKFSLATI